MGLAAALLFHEPEDATPLAPEERTALLQDWITHRNELNEAERDNIVLAITWARRRIRQIETADILTDLRSRYIKALRLADAHQIEELVAFARS